MCDISGQTMRACGAFLFIVIASGVVYAQEPPKSSVAITPASAPVLNKDGTYEVPIAALHVLPASPKIEFPKELRAYEIEDTIAFQLTISASGNVEKAKVIGGKIPFLKDAAEKTVKQWSFEPYLINGAPVRVRTQIDFHFNDTFDSYRDADGNPPARLDETASHALLLQTVPPKYPPDARSDRIQGQVVLRMIIGKDGHVKLLHILHGHPMLAPAAFNAVRQWTFKPYLVNGMPTEVDTPVTINFTLAG